ncbi:MAG: hypothetical protein BA863_06910 [Desulfovibrio sp. S3730MH75]|nr:MAG: hypothetical protein BA863_06910 [Desulfovibrio sp. S3730MH75]
MSVLYKLASMQDRRDEEPNKDLAKEFVDRKDIEGIREIAENLWNKDKKIQGDCDSVMEEIGRNAPELIEEYVADFLKLLSSKNNRRVWGAMINLSLIADRKPKEIFESFESISKTIENGSVITRDNGIKTLAIVASKEEEYNQVIFPFLIQQLKTCRPKSVPQYAESIFCAVKSDNREQYIDVLNQRLDILTSSQQIRVKKLLRKLQEL